MTQKARYLIAGLFALLFANFMYANCGGCSGSSCESKHVDAPAMLSDALDSHGSWMTDFEAAKALAAQENKPMLLDFTGSDWCGWCKKLNKEVFAQPEFKAYAGASLVLVEVDFPSKKPQSDAVKAQNEALQNQYKVTGYPTIILLSPEGEEIARTGYKSGGAEAYVKHLQSLLK